MTSHERLISLIGELDPFTGEALAQIITNVHDHGGDCDAAEYPPSHPRHFVRHAMTHVGNLDDDGCVRVYSDEGDWVYGKPEDVLRRVSETARAGM